MSKQVLSPPLRVEAVRDQRRQAILDAAYSSFLELGFSRTTTAEIAARARLSKRTIYEIFSNSKEIFAAVIKERQHLILELPRPVDEQLSVLETLFKIFRLDIDYKAEQARQAVINLLNRESVMFPELSDYLYESEVIRSREALIDWLENEMKRGRLPEIDTMICAGMLMDIVFGALSPRRREPEPQLYQIRQEHIKARIKIFLKGISA